MYSIYEDYLSMPKSLSFGEMTEVHRQMIDDG